MALLSLPQARAAARLRYPTVWTKTAGGVLSEAARNVSLNATFDIFLSHSYADANAITDEELLGVKALIEELNYTVYVDWVIDRQLSRDNVTSGTAEVLRHRMAQSRSLLFVTSTNSSKSRWMPWELGYMDGKKGTAAILPMAQQQGAGESFQGQEYLGIYPYVTRANSNDGKDMLWVHTDASTYTTFDGWLTGSKPVKH